METRSLDEAIDSQKKVLEKAKKPGFLTSEFWLAAATTLVGALVKFGILATETSGAAQIISTLMVVAGPVVYILARSGLKKGGVQALAQLLEALNKQEKDKK